MKKFLHYFIATLGVLSGYLFGINWVIYSVLEGIGTPANLLFIIPNVAGFFLGIYMFIKFREIDTFPKIVLYVLIAIFILDALLIFVVVGGDYYCSPKLENSAFFESLPYGWRFATCSIFEFYPPIPYDG